VCISKIVQFQKLDEYVVRLEEVYFEEGKISNVFDENQTSEKWIETLSITNMESF
jgi:hypothetical protein